MRRMPRAGAWKPLLARIRGPYYDPWESVSEPERRRAIAARLDEYVRHARTLTFYRKRLAGYKKGAEHPLERVPPLGSSDLRKLLPPKSRRLLVSGERGCSVFQSGGTTGEPKSALFSHEELEALALPNARGFYACGLRSGDRVANLFAVGGLYMTFLHIHRMLQEFGCVNFPFSNHTPPDFVRGAAKAFRINCIAGIASVAVDCLRGMAKLGLEGIRIDKLYYGGEHLYDSEKEELKRKFDIRTILAPGYGTVDTWYIGYQCMKCPTGVFHAHDDQTYMEIVDEGSGRHCAAAPYGSGITSPSGDGASQSAAAEAGMLYATPFPRRLTPVVRCRVGDRASWLREPCPCGRATPLFRLLGRGDDVLRIGYDSIDYAHVQKAAGGVKGLLSAVQMEKRRVAGKDQLVVRAESEAPPSRRKALAKTLAERIVRDRPTLRRLAAEGSVWPVRVEILPQGGIPRSARTGKLARVIDALR
ncbi:MAG: hypothetical protein HY922_02140 [Elusimicrobia bacterium]|nr:hypothetical protein [Elusimicrobiota bacterium]